ncbi:DUF1003 domain-containing protein [Flavobacterium sp.]|uniref:DUF1003 domain-containing protein n=1 Tax=Flavobacterium sp. TaxID=239 RepID=UPI003D12C2B4
MNNYISALSGHEIETSDVIFAKTIRKSVFQLIQQDYPNFTKESVISLAELNYYREKYISGFLLKDIQEITELEKAVLQSLKDNTFLSIIQDSNPQYTIGQKVADKVAEFGGSWTFILSFFGFLLIWISANVFLLANKGFDPYPFILLNLILSCLAALQAPIIMMSQNRQEEKDRERSKNDYMINLKSELEIRLLHEKIDHLIMHQEEALIEMQKVQIEMMDDILKQLKK